MCTSVGRNRQFIMISYKMCWWCAVFDMHHQNLMLLLCNVILQSDDIINDIITHAHVAGHITFWYKRDCTWQGVGSVTWDLQEVELLEACTGSDTSGESLWLEPTTFNCIKCIPLCVIPLLVFWYSSVRGKPGSATHSSTSTASAGGKLQGSWEAVALAGGLQPSCDPCSLPGSVITL